MEQIQFFGATWCPDCARAKKFLGEHGLDYSWHDIDKEPAAAKRVAQLTNGTNQIPVLAFDDGSLLVEPTDQQLADKLGIKLEPEKDYTSLIIVGAGPTGMAAAIYTTREDIDTLLLEGKVAGGLAGITDMIDNYPGFPEGVAGLKLAEDMEKQAKRFGAKFMTGVPVTSLSDEGMYKKLVAGGKDYYAKAVLIGTGSDYRKLGIPGEKEYTSRGVHYCATCDGPFYRDKRLVVVGGGNSAMQESLFLTKFATSIDMLVRGDELKGSEILIAKVKQTPKIKVHYGVTTTEIKGHGGRVVGVDGVNKDGKPVDFATDGVFVFIGLLPNTAWLKGTIDLDDAGFILTDRTFATSMKGVYAAGDVRSGATLQIASAVGEGVTAALMIREYLKEEG